MLGHPSLVKTMKTVVNAFTKSSKFAVGDAPFEVSRAFSLSNLT